MLQNHEVVYPLVTLTIICLFLHPFLFSRVILECCAKLAIRFPPKGFVELLAGPVCSSASLIKTFECQCLL